jgi:hypothetical protein
MFFKVILHSQIVRLSLLIKESAMSWVCSKVGEIKRFYIFKASLIVCLRQELFIGVKINISELEEDEFNLT